MLLGEQLLLLLGTGVLGGAGHAALAADLPAGVLLEVLSRHGDEDDGGRGRERAHLVVRDHVVVGEGEVLLRVEGARGLLVAEVGEGPVGEGGAGGGLWGVGGEDEVGGRGG